MKYFSYKIKMVVFLAFMLFAKTSYIYALDIPVPTDALTPQCPVVEGSPSTQQVSVANDFRVNVESSILYKMVTSQKNITSCQIAFTPGGNFFIQYKFPDKTRFSVERNPTTEHTEEIAHIEISTPPETLLKQIEKANFSIRDGCKIDWADPEIRKSKIIDGATDTIFRGEVCNCQARIQRSAMGRVTELGFKSTCQ
jgi:hypothetical protein